MSFDRPAARNQYGTGRNLLQSLLLALWSTMIQINSACVRSRNIHKSVAGTGRAGPILYAPLPARAIGPALIFETPIMLCGPWRAGGLVESRGDTAPNLRND